MCMKYRGIADDTTLVRGGCKQMCMKYRGIADDTTLVRGGCKQMCMKYRGIVDDTALVRETNAQPDVHVVHRHWWMIQPFYTRLVRRMQADVHEVQRHC